MTKRKIEVEREPMKIFPIKDSDQYIVQKSNRTLDEYLEAKIREGQIPAFAKMATREEARAQYIQWLGLRRVAHDAFYFASISTGCECPYFQERLMPCKHLWALVNQVAGLSMNSLIQTKVPSHMIMLDPEVTAANYQVPLASLPPPPSRASSPALAGPSSVASRRRLDPLTVVNQEMATFKRDCEFLVKVGYEMEDETRREMMQAMAELKTRFGGPSIRQSLFISNQRPASGTRAASRASTLVKSARTDQLKRKRRHESQPAGPIVAGDFKMKNKKRRAGDFISGQEIEKGKESVKFSDERMS